MKISNLFLLIFLFNFVSSKSMSETFLCSFFNYNCPKVEFKELVFRDRLFFKKFSNVPFTGQVYGDYGEGYIIDGNKEGFWVEYRKNGQVLFKGTYKNGLRDGYWTTYNDWGGIIHNETGYFKKGIKQ